MSYYDALPPGTIEAVRREARRCELRRQLRAYDPSNDALENCEGPVIPLDSDPPTQLRTQERRSRAARTITP